MALLLRDFVTTTVATAPVGTTGTNLTVSPGDGALFPLIPTGSRVPAVIEAVDGSQREAVMCVSRTGDTLTLERGASAIAWTGNGQTFYLALTAAAVDYLRQASEHSVVPAGGLTSSTVQAALEELDSRLAAESEVADELTADLAALQSALNEKASLGGAVFTGHVKLPGDATDPLHAAPLQQVLQKIAEMAFTVGDYKFSSRTSFPALHRWLLCDGRTIGNASSGATALASAEAQALFEHLWGTYGQTLCPVTTSTGAASSRGASAAEDWSGNKRIALLDWRGLTPKVHHGGSALFEADTARVLGSYQGDAIRNIMGSISNTFDSGGFQSPSGPFSVSGTGYIRSSGEYPVGAATVTFDASTVVPTAAENRVKNRSLNVFIRY